MSRGVVHGAVSVMLTPAGAAGKAKRCRKPGGVIRYRSDPNTFTCGGGPMGIQHARKELASVGARLFGVVLNSVDFKDQRASDYYYMRYSSEYYHRGGETAEVQ